MATNPPQDNDLSHLPTPSVLVDHDRLVRNIQQMQAHCDAQGVALWPHIKTHKMVEVARLQLAAGAQGLTCAKIGEAEALLPSGVRSVFIAHSLVDPAQAPRLRALAEALDRLLVACTSPVQAEALERVLASVDLTLPVMMAVDTGLHREGARGTRNALALADTIRRLPHLRLHGLYTHEGHAYGRSPAETDPIVRQVHETLWSLREQIDPALALWPGCSVTARAMATLPGVAVVRPGAYVFGDLALAETTGAMDWNDVALTVLATVVDLPETGLALIDAGSKTFSSDKTAEGVSGKPLDRQEFAVTRCNEEHGYVTGPRVDTLKIGDKVRLVPAHVCTVVNLTDTVMVVREHQIVGQWRVDARGKVQ